MGTGGWFGLVAPAGTPPAVIERLNQAVRAAMDNAEFRKKAEDVGGTLMPTTPQEFQAQINEAWPVTPRWPRPPTSRQTDDDASRFPARIRIRTHCRGVAAGQDSPHSGETYPADFGAAASLAQLRQGEDTHVDALWSAAPALGATLVAANFPRVYIDPNRTLRDLIPSCWPNPGPGRWSPVKRRGWARG